MSQSADLSVSDSHSQPTAVSAPVAPARRVAAIDVARGVALLGIFCVNIHYMGQPSGTYFDHHPPANADPFSVVAWYLYKTLCEGKFYPLFATLFGAGLALQFTRAFDREARKDPSFPPSPWSIWWAHPIRRLIALLVIGLAHALLVWFGDILVVYALLGFVMLLLVRLSIRGLLISASLLAGLTALFILVGVIGVALTGSALPTAPAATTSETTIARAETAEAASTSAETVAPDEAPADAPSEAEAKPLVLDDSPPFDQIINGFRNGQLTGPWDQAYRELETRALRDGPYSQLFAVRAIGWVMATFFTILSGGTLILALFCLGAILVKADLFHPRHEALHRRLSLFGLLVGIPIAVLATWAKPMSESQAWAALVYYVGFVFGGPLLTMGYLFTIVRWSHSGFASGIARLFADAGRMALTTYLLCSILGTAVFYYWGLGWFGQTTTIEQFGILVIIFAGVVLFARLWLGRFAFGPAEWIWRTVTYLRPQPLRKGAGLDE